MAEKRKFRRLPVPSIACRVFQECRLIDLSIVGAFVESARPFAPGTRAEIEFTLPTRPNRPVRAGVQVEWGGDYFGGRGTPCLGMGLSFTTVSAEDRLAIAAFLRKAYDMTRGALGVKTRLPARLVVDGRRAEGLVRELGERGVFIETPAVVPLGSELEVLLDLPNATAPVKAQGVVVRIEPHPSGAPPASGEAPRGLRLEWSDLSVAARELIKSYLDERRAAGTG